MSRAKSKPSGASAKTRSPSSEADQRPSESARPLVLPQLREYDAAWGAFQGAVLEGFAQLDPLLSRVPVVSRPYAAVSRMTHNGKPIDEPTKETESTFQIQVEDIRSSNIDVFTERLYEMSTRFIEAMAQQLYASMSRITSATGQVVSGEGQPSAWDALIDGIERMPPSFDREGRFNTDIFVNPATLARLPPPTKEQRERLDAILAQKKREHDSTRRSRRLPAGA
jgi:hypothetical protein